MNQRAATPDDAGALAELGARAFTAKFGAMYAAEDLAAYLVTAHTPDVVAAELANDAMRVAVVERHGVLAGFCKLHLRGGWPEYARGERAAELKQLYTDPMLVGSGIGGTLMQWALNTVRALGADEIQLSVWSGNHGAQRFYERHGFAKVADVHFWVGTHRDEEFLFSLPLA